MRISLNLATKPFADIGPRIKNLRIAMAALAITALALGYGVYSLDAKAKAAHARERVLETQIDRINKERQGYQAMMREPDNAATLTI
jgi:type IV pilus assembly protein PilN